MILAALFDYDSTLADTDAIHHACWNGLLAEFGVSIDEAFYSRHCSGALSEPIASRIIAEFPALQTQIDPRQLADGKDARYQSWVATHNAPLMEGVSELLEWLGAHGIPVGVVTGAPRDAIQLTVREHGVLDRFQVLVTHERVPRGKPAPDGYQLALRELNVCDPGRAISFEDTRDGTLAAKAAGLRSIAVPHTYTRGHDFGAADHVIPSLTAAPPLLEALLRGNVEAVRA